MLYALSTLGKTCVPCTTTVNEPLHSKTYKMTCSPGEDSDQPAYLQSLVSPYESLLDKLWVAKDLSGQQSVYGDTQSDLSRHSACRKRTYVLSKQATLVHTYMHRLVFVHVWILSSCHGPFHIIWGYDVLLDPLHSLCSLITTNAAPNRNSRLTPFSIVSSMFLRN